MIAEQDIEVEKFIEIIGGKMIGSVSGYNYSNHNPERKGEYYSWSLGSGKGNSIFIIPAGTKYKYDPHQDIYQSEYIRFSKLILGTIHENFGMGKR
jgi:hypothetical protein